MSVTMKTLYLVGGAMGVGKTTTCRILRDSLDKSVFLDGDWCWDMHPFTVNEETKALVEDNICHMLNNFLHCSAFEHVVFCWVMHDQSIIDAILSRVDTTNCKVVNVSLICTEDALRQRLIRDVNNGVRTPDVIARAVQRLKLYRLVESHKVDVSHIPPEEAAERILALAAEE